MHFRNNEGGKMAERANARAARQTGKIRFVLVILTLENYSGSTNNRTIFQLADFDSKLSLLCRYVIFNGVAYRQVI